MERFLCLLLSYLPQRLFLPATMYLREEQGQKQQDTEKTVT